MSAPGALSDTRYILQAGMTVDAVDTDPLTVKLGAKLNHPRLNVIHRMSDAQRYRPLSTRSSSQFMYFRFCLASSFPRAFQLSSMALLMKGSCAARSLEFATVGPAKER